MPDREKVIERLGKVSYYFKSLLAVGWQNDVDTYREHMESVNMTIELLKEQEPVKPIWLQPGTGNSMIKCGACLENIKYLYNYCPWCGRKVKLEWPLMNGSEISNPILMNCVC